MLWVNLIMDSLGALALASEPPVPELLERPPYGRNASLLSFQMKFNMFGQATYQLVVLIIMLFSGGGESGKGDVCDVSQIPVRAEDKNSKGLVDDKYPCEGCGGILDIPSGSGRDSIKDKPTQHYTIIFNAFVMMQLFNWINCRKIYHEFNVFSGIQNNMMFCVIWIVCFLTQILLIEVGAIGMDDGVELICNSVNSAFKTIHLNLGQWVVCMVLGLFSLPWQWVLITVAKIGFPNMGKIERPQDRPAVPQKRLSGKGTQENQVPGNDLQAFPSNLSAASVTSGMRQGERVRSSNESFRQYSSEGKHAEKIKAVEQYRASIGGVSSQDMSKLKKMGSSGGKPDKNGGTGPEAVKIDMGGGKIPKSQGD